MMQTSKDLEVNISFINQTSKPCPTCGRVSFVCVCICVWASICVGLFETTCVTFPFLHQLLAGSMHGMKPGQDDYNVDRTLTVEIWRRIYFLVFV
jgi:hypothetical protein